MLIAVLNYGARKLRVGEQVAILDTSDLTVQLVLTKELYETGLYKSIKNFYYHDLYGNFIFKRASIADIITSDIYYNHYLYINGKTIHYEDQKKNLVLDGVEYMAKDDIVLGWNFAYLFRFREYIVLRFAQACFSTDLSSVYDWYSIAYDKKGNVAAHWYKGHPSSTLAVKIDTLLEV